MSATELSGARVKLEALLRTLYVNLRSEPVFRERPIGSGHAHSFRMFAGDPKSTVAYFVTPDGKLATRTKRGWVWLEPPRIVPVGQLLDTQAHAWLNLAEAARKRHQRVRVA